MAGGVTGGHSREPDFICPTHARSFINFHGQGSSTRFHVIWVRFRVSRTDTDSSNSILRKWGRHVHKHQKTPPAKDYNVLSGKLQRRERLQSLVPAKDYNALSGLTRSDQNPPQRATTPCWHLEPKQGFIPLDRNRDTQLLQVMKHKANLSKQIEPN